MKTVLGLVTFILFSFVMFDAHSAPNMTFRGTLIQEPCTVTPGNETINVDFKDVINKFLYRYQRTEPKPFQLQLSDCDLTIGQTVNLSFTGTESTVLPGLLAVDPGSQAINIAIGLEMKDGTPILINQPVKNIPLSSGTTLLQFNAYVQGEPDALAQQSLTYGRFTATSVFLLEYP
ncbi:type 1 fimbrial protein [Rahnella sp. SAP-29]|nr:type 1 fimbrial protein [Rahnella laticis]